MDKAEARQIIDAELARYRAMAYEQLAELVDKEPVTKQIVGPSGAGYEIEIMFFWDDQAGGDVRVIGAIDDGGLRAYHPLTSGFHKGRSEV